MNRQDKPQVVVSLTSFPPAITYAVQAVKSILCGSVLPDKLVLYLAAPEFDGVALPPDLLAMETESSVFEIRYCERNIRSYKKLVPALADFPQAIIVTIDDDIWYHRHMLRDLLYWHEKYPNAIIAHRAKKIKIGQPYRKWKKYRWYHFVWKKINLGLLNIQTGVGGVLYPPHSLREDMLNPDLFMSVAPTVDDIWFWAAGVAKGTPVLPVPFGRNKPKGLPKPKSISLKMTNFKGQTDRNLSTLMYILEHYPEIERKLK